ncbi:hypothetical protein HBI56_217570 [Parastagonospora nodorum]|nr:hypothetical protein HBH51_222180 [Parastagonospora nodorum]KAH3992265.1 hypothetical protein HBI10_220780 [Parastagonospora nodorum]KAH4009059.1 hypothetical protein HBI13_226830 [Parastagonospora nodorum]KAH4085906.1 hypothetical protein HBH46_207190 [Parastagonospora nodorum]KAH4220462.1 hypothetical protein HBI06_175670 [Parastagonospora nodorum]
MPRCLLWKVSSPHKPSEPALAYRAPSWSWASMNATVYYPEEELEMFDTVKPLPGFNIVDADVKERSLGSFMHVTEGYILVTGTLYSARYFNREHQLGSYYRGSLETSFPGLHKGEWKRCLMDKDDTERDCFLLPCMISDVDVERDDTHLILRQFKRADHESDEDERNSVDGENTEDIGDQGDEEEMRIKEQIHESYHMEGHDDEHSDKSSSKRSKSDDTGLEDVCRIYMLVLEELLPGVTKSDDNDNRDKDKRNEVRTFRRVGLACWKVSMAQIHKLPNVERVRIE